jgi:sulfur transfer protein SufE
VNTDKTQSISKLRAVLFVSLCGSGVNLQNKQLKHKNNLNNLNECELRVYIKTDSHNSFYTVKFIFFLA